MPEAPQTLDIRKYPNRRFYDATRSRHVTISDLHNLIVAGHELKVTDSSNGRDITNEVLAQIILERDPLKLAMFPANVLHQMIRTQQQFLGSVLEDYFRQMLEAHRASQERWAQFVRNTLGPFMPPAGGPLDWTRGMWDAFGTARPPANDNAPAAPREAQPARRGKKVKRKVRR
jgi:polyhydroxyalkanoate synthesis repressor PhaR